MKNLILFALVLAAILGAFLWMFLTSEEDDALDEVQISTRAADESRGPRRTTTPDPKEKEKPRVVRRAKVNFDVPLTFADTANLDDSNSTEVHVFDALTKESLAGAVVTVLEIGRQGQNDRAHLTREDPIGFFRAFGTHYKTSSDGTVRIPDHRIDCEVAAFTDDLFVSQKHTAPLPLKIELDATPILRIRARVLSAEGTPVAGVFVRLGLTHTSHVNGKKGSDWILDRQRSETGADGIATIGVPGGELYAQQGLLQDGAVFVDLDGLFVPRVVANIDLEKPPTEIIDLRMPQATGSIIVRLQNPDGSPYLKTRQVYVGEYDKSDPHAATFAKSNSIFTGFAIDGQLTVPQVTCGKTFRFSMVRSDLADFFLSDVHRGPKNPGETTEIVLKFSKKAPVLRGRILDSSGVPVTNQKIGVILTTLRTWRWSIPSTLNTDKDGRFSFGLGEATNSSTTQKSRSFIVHRIGGLSTPAEIAKVELPNDPIEKDIDLSDIVLAPAATLLKGKVIDANGAPIYRAHVMADIRHLSSSDRAKETFIPFYTQRTGRDGEFEVFGLSTSDEMRLMVNADGYLRRNLTCKIGQKDIAVFMAQPGSLKGRLVLSNGTSAIALHGELIHQATQAKIGVVFKNDGVFSKAKVPAGKYRFLVTGHKSHAEALVDQVIDILPGQEHDFGDLRVEFEGARLDLVMVEPKVVPRGLLIVVQEPFGGKEITRFVMNRNSETIYVPVNSCDLTLTTAGFRQTTITGATGGKVELRMTPGIPVTFEFSNPESVPKGYEVEFWVDPNLGTGPFWLKQIGPQAVIPFHSPGTYRMSATIAKAGRLAKRERFPIQPLRIKVLDSNSTQNFRLRLEKDDVAKAIKRLSKR